MQKLPLKVILAVLVVSALVIGVSWRLGYQRGVNKQSAGSSGSNKLLFYRNPMNPAITSPVPAKDEMGMDYIPVYEDEAKTPAKSLQQQADDFFSEEKGVSGLGVVTMTEQGIRLSGVQVAAVVQENIRRTLRTVGLVVPDETRIHRVQTKVGGWVEALLVNYMGQLVKKGSPILSVYSPELLSSQEEFIKTRQSALRSAADAGDRTSAQRLRQSAQRRLELFDVPPDFIKELERTGKPQRAVTLLSPVDGFVTAKDIFLGQEVKPGMELYTITDLSVVWVDAEVYEYETRDVHVGQEGFLTTSYDPSLRLAGKIAYIYPYLNRESRTLKLRFEFDNKDFRLKPGMFVDVNLMIDYGEGLVIPDSAIIDSGIRKVVFVDKGEGRFEPRQVKAGVRSEGKTQVLSGLNVQDRVVVKANFLLDSESRLRALIDAAMAAKK
ncbi:MAG: efflux RND transporter periplasmic adaptor subunit [Desulfatirhabdiaceae bacterium]|nr:efflux RND transporter periplasmic adaptor subunit [Desulfatirhabdiaceae bacterium]